MNRPQGQPGGTGPPTSRGPSPGPAGRVGIVGAGQLARMMVEAASRLDIDVTVLAEGAEDAAARITTSVLHGSPKVPEELAALAKSSDVVTFDHEHVDLTLLADLIRRGHVVRPALTTLHMATDKAHMRRQLDAAGIAVPRYEVLDGDSDSILSRVDAVAATNGWPVVLKAARGGYDGKGVWPVGDHRAAAEVCRRATNAGTTLLVEELVNLDAELAVIVARRPSGEYVTWPAVETAQVDGVCREVLVPGRVPPDVGAAATALALRVAEVAQSVGVLAVELFSSDGSLMVNEVAARPHNSGHWTIEGSVTSQFENHLRAVLDLPLGSTSLTAPCIASVNVFGNPHGTDPRDLLPVGMAEGDAHIHLYGKTARPSRKLGHVTVCGDDPGEIRRQAWAVARALGTPVPRALAAQALASKGVEP